MLKACKDTDGCVNQYRCALAIYSMNFLSYSYGIIIDITINAPGCEKCF